MKKSYTVVPLKITMDFGIPKQYQLNIGSSENNPFR